MDPELAPERLRWWREPLRARRHAAIEIGKEAATSFWVARGHPRAKRASHAESSQCRALRAAPSPSTVFTGTQGEHDGGIGGEDLAA
jgi:hypothetical protein